MARYYGGYGICTLKKNTELPQEVSDEFCNDFCSQFRVVNGHIIVAMDDDTFTTTFIFNKLQMLIPYIIGGQIVFEACWCSESFRFIFNHQRWYLCGSDVVAGRRFFDYTQKQYDLHIVTPPHCIIHYAANKKSESENHFNLIDRCESNGIDLGLSTPDPFIDDTKARTLSVLMFGRKIVFNTDKENRKDAFAEFLDVCKKIGMQIDNCTPGTLYYAAKC